MVVSVIVVLGVVILAALFVAIKAAVSRRIDRWCEAMVCGFGFPDLQDENRAKGRGKDADHPTTRPNVKPKCSLSLRPAGADKPTHSHLVP